MNDREHSGLVPLGRAVLVEVEDIQAKSGSIVIPDSVRSSNAMIETRARVISLGAVCWPDEPPRARPGDLVLIAKMAGVQAISPVNGRMYRFVNDRDIFARIEEIDHE